MASLSRSHYENIVNLKTEVENAKCCHGYIYTVKMIIKIKLNGASSISLLTFTYTKSTTETWCKLCSESTMETPEWRQKRHSDVSIVNSTANLELVIIRRYISLEVSKQLTVLGHSMLAEIVWLTALPRHFIFVHCFYNYI